MKKLFSIFVIFAVMISSVPAAFAYQFPHAIWQYDDLYIAAESSGDLSGLISAGEQALAVIANEPENETIMSYRASRMFEIAKAYESLGNYKKSGEWYSQAIRPNEYMGFADAVKICKLKARLYEPTVSLYKQTSLTQAYFGAKNELETGVLWGLTSDSKTRNEFSNESMTMVYHHYGKEFNKYMETFMQDAVDKNIAIEFALNLQNEAADVLYVKSQETWLDSFIDMLNKYDSVPIYLRFAGEVNVWQNQPNPDDFKEAFRFVANKIHARAPHVAVVFGLNFVSDWNGDYTKYYPGDEYVDWVGVSLYMNKYFNGQRTTTYDEKVSEQMFFANDAAEPVQIMKEIVDTYGNRKPIMVFESGAAHYTRTLGEDSTEWAKKRLEESVNYLPMVYPQIKIIGYFNTVMPEEAHDYALESNPQLRWYYTNLVKSPQFIQDEWDNGNAVSYENCNFGFTANGSVETLGVYAYDYGSNYKSVSYYIDNVQVGWSETIPYLCDIDFSPYTAGSHTLTVKAASDTGNLIEKSVNFNINGNNTNNNNNTDDIKIVVNGSVLENLDQPPVIIDGRTLVPVRAILESIGATVSWDGENQIVTTKKGDTTLQLVIGSNMILKNGTQYAIDVAPQIINSRTCIPARAVSEHFGLTVDWDGETRTVYITE